MQQQKKLDYENHCHKNFSMSQNKIVFLKFKKKKKDYAVFSLQSIKTMCFLEKQSFFHLMHIISIMTHEKKIF